MALLELTGNVRNRFVEAAVLLRMLDPVRGEATVHGLDQVSHEMITPRERLLKRKFLDSFALICAIKKDGDSTSAACMEEGAPQGTIIRIASNAGIGEKSSLRRLRITPIYMLSKDTSLVWGLFPNPALQQEAVPYQNDPMLILKLLKILPVLHHLLFLTNTITS